jgi:hypothetical protein
MYVKTCTKEDPDIVYVFLTLWWSVSHNYRLQWGKFKEIKSSIKGSANIKGMKHHFDSQIQTCMNEDHRVCGI